MRKKMHIPTLIGVVLLVLGVAGGVLLVNRQTIFQLGAAPEATPKDVRVTNVTDSSFTISWITDKQAVGFVKWGETSNLGQTAQGEGGTKAQTAHSVTIKSLAKGKTYYFTINSGGADYKNNGTPWTATTVGITSNDTSRVSGTILLSTGVPATEALVYIDAPGMTQQSTIVSNSGNWVITIPVTGVQTLLDVYVQGGAQGIATAQVYTESANPIPAITLGKTYDLRSATPNKTGNVPDSSVTLPTESTGSAGSRFELTEKTTPKPSTQVIVKSISEGETVFTQKPQISGTGPANTTITVEIHSTTEITQNVKTASDGSWTFNVPQNLETGAHTLTISWKDAQGILQTITRTFIVEAQAAEPAFEATPSASPSLTPAPTSSPSATPKATSTPTASPSATPTATPTPKPTATATPATSSALPNAGSPLQTVMMLSFGASLILGGIFVGLRQSQ